MEFAVLQDRLDWSDYRLVLEIARAGSLTLAGRQSGRSHATLFRRLNAIEERLGTRLFDRHRSGYALTGAGEAVVAAAKTFEDLTVSTERQLADLDRRAEGLVTLTTTDALFSGLIAGVLTRFHAQNPAVSVEVRLSNDLHDLARREADIAVRPTTAPEPHLFGRALGTIRQAVYAPAHIADDAGLPWIGPAASMNYVQYEHWLRRQAGGERWMRVEGTLGIHAAVRAGAGRAVLPCYLGDADEALRRCGPVIEELGIPLWILIHPDLKDLARVRRVLEFLGEDRQFKERL
ncbi:LysR family transcriptional regulator [Stappia indica]|uniref:LysR family transcriptional regulator n=1 Tax=Stappia indica TaxID=538381 RepID=A0A857CD25_9HYPH|nr:LysR family transcriptional regulator [Stappia indica]QGZ36924.1 LysR family transcriptional regulator [Stappia indica]